MTYDKIKRIFKYILLAAAVFLAAFFLWPRNDFDESLLNTDNIYGHISELSSEEYQGRLSGSEGDKKALLYIENYFKEIGVEPAGVNDTYFQPFTTIIPDIDTDPTFTISSEDGNLIKELIMYKDYNMLTSMNGGSVDFSGDLIFVGNDLLRIEPEYIKDRVVVIEANRLTPKHVNYVLQSGGKGVICTANVSFYNPNQNYEFEKSISISGKTGESILVGYISNQVHREILKLMDESDIGEEVESFKILGGVHINVDIGFPIVETANILGKIEGESSDGNILLVTTNIDGVGAGTDGKYFPGVLNHTSGIATMLEVARVIASQDSLPQETIVFAGWNGQYQQLSGSSHYIDNPVYPLQRTRVIHMEGIGKETLEGLKVSSGLMKGTILRDRIVNYGLDSEMKVVEGLPGYSAINQFIDMNVPAVVLTDSNNIANTYEDTIENIDREHLENSAKVFLNYIKRDVYKDRGFDYLSVVERVLIGITIFGTLISYFIVKTYHAYPNKKIMGYSVENIYFSTPNILLRKVFSALISGFFAVFMLTILASIDPGSNIKMINNDISTNISGYLTVKRSVLYLRTLLSPSDYNMYITGNLLETIYDSSKLSVMLISSSLAFSTIVGILRGMYEGYRSRKAKLGSLGTLVFFSIPDVLIVLLTLLGYTFVAVNFPAVRDLTYLKGFVLPLLTLSIIPTIYISRITFITVQEELGKDYIRNAIAKGFSRKKTIFYELIPAIVFKIVDTLPAIMTMLLTNMIIVEWLFNYRGILYYLLYFYNRQDVYRFVPLAMTLGFMYIVFTWGVQFLARLINPLKNKGAKQ
ncbi:M28 family peptidase [Gudongella sp. DL1XJH-153]|uniref:M28 family peptidase n=1 Tax=Gudongella sp. DL1XJH-153 TaxID=3409804 RepID=UPI003BB6E9C7